MGDKYVRRLKDGRILIATEALMARRDYVPYDPETAKIRIKAAKKRLKDLESDSANSPSIPVEVLENSVELAKLEDEILAREKDAENKALGIDPKDNEAPTDESVLADRQAKMLAEDAAMLKIKDMKTANEIEGYILEFFGEESDLKKIKVADRLEFLRKRALELRATQLLEEV